MDLGVVMVDSTGDSADADTVDTDADTADSRDTVGADSVVMDMADTEVDSVVVETTTEVMAATRPQVSLALLPFY